MKIKELIELLGLFDSDREIDVGGYNESHRGSHGPIWAWPEGNRIRIGIDCSMKDATHLTVYDGKVMTPDEYYQARRS